MTAGAMAAVTVVQLVTLAGVAVAALVPRLS